jgi:hypothetical protein
MVMGTSWMLSLRRCAVTTTSGIPSSSAAKAAPALEPSTARMAQVNLWLLFKTLSLQSKGKNPMRRFDASSQGIPAVMFS